MEDHSESLLRWDFLAAMGVHVFSAVGADKRLQSHIVWMSGA